MKRKCECGEISNGSFCSACGRTLLASPSIDDVDELERLAEKTLKAVHRYFKTFRKSLVVHKLAEYSAGDIIEPLRFFFIAAVIVQCCYTLAWPDDPLSRFELPPRMAASVGLLKKVPLETGFLQFIGLVVIALVPYLLVRLVRARLNFKSWLRIYAYQQGGWGLVVALIFLAAAPFRSSFVGTALTFLGTGLVSIAFIQLGWSLGPLAGRTRKFGVAVLMVAAIITAVVSNVYIDRKIIGAYHIVGSSMEPTLKDGDVVLANKLIPRSRMPRRGELATFRYTSESAGIDGRDSIGRIVGLPKDRIDMRLGRLFINGVEQQLADVDKYTYVVHSDYSNTDVEVAANRQTEMIDGHRHSIVLRDYHSGDESHIVPEGCYFVLGDNRDNSADSRLLGAVEGPRLTGLIYYRTWPIARSGPLE